MCNVKQGRPYTGFYGRLHVVLAWTRGLNYCHPSADHQLSVCMMFKYTLKAEIFRCPHIFGNLIVTLLRELLQVRLDRMPVAQVNMLTSSEPSWVTSICSRPSNPSYTERDQWRQIKRENKQTKDPTICLLLQFHGQCNGRAGFYIALAQTSFRESIDDLDRFIWLTYSTTPVSLHFLSY